MLKHAFEGGVGKVVGGGVDALSHTQTHTMLCIHPRTCS